MLKVADKAGIKVLVLLNTFTGIQLKEMGSPREKYKNWIGSLIPDNHFAGYKSAQMIIDRALASNLQANDGNLHLLAIAGDDVTQASIERVRGLKQAASEYPNVTVKQIFTGYWQQDLSQSILQKALKRYPQTGAIWAANDPMAIGAITAAQTRGKTPGKDIFIGGTNWDAPALALLKQGTLESSMGGHFMTGGWGLVMLYDYHHGKDFATDGFQRKHQIFGALQRQNIDRYLAQFGESQWEDIDFTRFSKVLTPGNTEYAFHLNNILK